MYIYIKSIYSQNEWIILMELWSVGGEYTTALGIDVSDCK